MQQEETPEDFHPQMANGILQPSSHMPPHHQERTRLAVHDEANRHMNDTQQTGTSGNLDEANTGDYQRHCNFTHLH